MAGWEQTIIIGNVGRDPELRYTAGGVPVCDFSVAVTRKIGSGDERQERTNWYRVTCWRQRAEIAAQYVHKGMQIMVVGTVESSAYLDRSGNPASSLELTADNFQMLGGRDDAHDGRGDREASAPAERDNDSIPF